MIVVTNKRFEKGDKDTFYCGRGSPVGNPYELKDANNDVERDECISKYDKWFEIKLLEKNEKILSYLNVLRNHHKKTGILKLQCFCSPRRCHCDTIKKLLDDLFLIP